MIKVAIYFGKEEKFEGLVREDELVLFQAGVIDRLTIHDEEEVEGSIGEQLSFDEHILDQNLEPRKVTR